MTLGASPRVQQEGDRAMIARLMARFGLVALALALSCAPTWAQTSQWWQSALPQMKNPNSASTWLASSGDTVDNIARTMYGVPPDKTNALNAVSNAIVSYNEALARARQADPAKFGDKVTAMPGRGALTEGSVYFAPDPASLDRILRGESPDSVVAASLSNPDNLNQAKGEAGFSPIHTFGPLSTDVADGSTGAPAGAPAGSAPPTALAPVGSTAGGVTPQPVDLLGQLSGVTSAPVTALPPGAASYYNTTNGNTGALLLQYFTAYQNQRLTAPAAASSAVGVATATP